MFEVGNPRIISQDLLRMGFEKGYSLHFSNDVEMEWVVRLDFLNDITS